MRFFIVLFSILFATQAYADCLENPRLCDNSQLCTYAADKSNYGYVWDTGWPRHLKEAQRRGLKCKVSPPKPRYKKIQPIYDAFTVLDLESRKEVQSQLKAQGLYKSGIDGLYGKRTQTAIADYIQQNINSMEINDKNVQNGLASLLAGTEVEEASAKTNAASSKTDGVDTYPDLVKNEPAPITEMMMLERIAEGDFQSAILAAKILAPEGNSAAQFVLGSAYAEGLGVLQQFKFAHMWLNIASLNGSNDAVQKRNELQKNMTPEAVMEAQELAMKCIRSEYKDCGIVSIEATETVENERAKTVSSDELKNAFLSASTTRRKQIQFALKDLGLYGSSIDGKWGAGTKRGLENFTKLSERDLTNADQTFENLLSKVDVPVSFSANAPDNNKSTKPAITQQITTQPNFRAPSGWRNVGNATAPFEQAHTICRSQANNVTAKSVLAPGTTTNCLGGGFGVTCNSSPNIDLGTTLGLLINKKNRQANYYTSCMAQYGWVR